MPKSLAWHASRMRGAQVPRELHSSRAFVRGAQVPRELRAFLPVQLFPQIAHSWPSFFPRQLSFERAPPKRGRTSQPQSELTGGFSSEARHRLWRFGSTAVRKTQGGCPVPARGAAPAGEDGSPGAGKVALLVPRERAVLRPAGGQLAARADENDSPSDTNDTDTDYDTASEGQGYESDEFDRLLTRLIPRGGGAPRHNADPGRRVQTGARSARCGTGSSPGPELPEDRRKQAPAPAVMECVKVDVFSFDDGPCANVANARPESWLNRQRAARTDASASGRDEPWTFVFQFMNPGPPHVSIALASGPREARGRSLRELLDAEEESPFGRALARFVRGTGTNGTRGSRWS